MDNQGVRYNYVYYFLYQLDNNNKQILKKSRIRDTLNLSTNEDNRTDTDTDILFGGGGIFFNNNFPRNDFRPFPRQNRKI